MPTSSITDSVLWFKNIHSAELRSQLERLDPEHEVTLVADGVPGPWQRMKAGADGRPTPGIKPVGPMKKVWAEWYRTRRGQAISLETVVVADDFLIATSALFSEWNSAEDCAAFDDL